MIDEAVNIAFHAQFIDEDGVLRPNEIAEDAATAMLDELARVESAMWTLRPAHVAAA